MFKICRRFNLPRAPRAVAPLARAVLGTVVLNCATLAPAQDTVQLRTNFYTITGSTERALRRALNESRPWKNQDATDARTDWQVQWSYTYAPAGGGFRVRSVETKTTITYTLPRWTPDPDAPRELRAGWAKYLAALQTHEEGHARIARAAAAEIRQRVAGLKSGLDAGHLEKSVNEAAGKALAGHRERDAQYDKKTLHGATQGAVFPDRPR